MYLNYMFISSANILHGPYSIMYAFVQNYSNIELAMRNKCIIYMRKLHVYLIIIGVDNTLTEQDRLFNNDHVSTIAFIMYM